MGFFSSGDLFGSVKKLTEPVYKMPHSPQTLIPVYRIAQNGIFEIEKKKGQHLFDKAYLLMDINYATENEVNQEKIIEKYCKLLNTFNVSFKIVVTNNKKNLKKFREEMLAKPEKDIFAQEMERILEEKIREGKKEIEQVKYLVVSVEKEDYESAKNYFTSLESDLAGCMRELESGITPLDWKERLRSLYAIYRLGHEEEYLEEMTWEMLLAKKMDWKNSVCNIGLDVQKEHMETEEHYICTLFGREYPKGLKDCFFAEIANVGFHTVTTLDIAPIPDHITQQKLMDVYLGIEHTISKQQELLNRNHSFSNEISYDKRKEKEQVEAYLDEVRSNDQSMFQVGFYIVVQASTMEELKSHVSNIQSIGQRASLQIEVHEWNQLEAFQTALPLGGRYVKTMRPFFTQSLAAFMPFYVQELEDREGIYYGTNRLSKNIVRADRKKLTNGNGFILATTGGGKSMSTKMEFINVAEYTSDQLIIIDPQNEYKGLVEEMGGQFIDLSADTTTYINPLDIPSKEVITAANKKKLIGEKVEYMLSFCEQATQHNLSAGHKSVIGRAVEIMVERFLADVGAASPTLKDFKEIIGEQEEAEARELKLVLELYVEGSLNIFAHEMNVDLNNSRILCFGINNLGEDLKALSMLNILESIQNRIEANFLKGIATRLYIDEFHVLTGMDLSEKYLEQIWKKVRKLGGLCLGITQNLSDLLVSKRTATLVGNSEFILLLRQSPVDLDLLKATFKLSEPQLQFLMTSAIGVGLLKFGDKWIPIDTTIPKGPLYDRLNTNFHERVRESLLEKQE